MSKKISTSKVKALETMINEINEVSEGKLVIAIHYVVMSGTAYLIVDGEGKTTGNKYTFFRMTGTPDSRESLYAGMYRAILMDLTFSNDSFMDKRDGVTVTSIRVALKEEFK